MSNTTHVQRLFQEHAFAGTQDGSNLADKESQQDGSTQPTVLEELSNRLNWTRIPLFRRFTSKRTRPHTSLTTIESSQEQTTTTRTTHTSTYTPHIVVTAVTGQDTFYSGNAPAIPVTEPGNPVKSPSTSVALTATLGALGSVVVLLVVLIAYFGFFRRRRMRGTQNGGNIEGGENGGITNFAYHKSHILDHKLDRLSIIPECAEELEYEYSDPDNISTTMSNIIAMEYQYIDPDKTSLKKTVTSDEQYMDPVGNIKSNNITYEYINPTKSKSNIIDPSEVEYEYVDPVKNTLPTDAAGEDYTYVDPAKANLTKPKTVLTESETILTETSLREGNVYYEYVDADQTSMTSKPIEEQEEEYIDPVTTNLTNLNTGETTRATNNNSVYQSMVAVGLDQHIYTESKECPSDTKDGKDNYEYPTDSSDLGSDELAESQTDLQQTVNNQTQDIMQHSA